MKHEASDRSGCCEDQGHRNKKSIVEAALINQRKSDSVLEHICSSLMSQRGHVENVLQGVH
jgi:hypothetical protein